MKILSQNQQVHLSTLLPTPPESPPNPNQPFCHRLICKVSVFIRELEIDEPAFEECLDDFLMIFYRNLALLYIPIFPVFHLKNGGKRLFSINEKYHTINISSSCTQPIFPIMERKLSLNLSLVESERPSSLSRAFSACSK